ncbi:MAG: class I adenylate-forming enzyme family protein [Myxococcota bacterium]|nr:class I adenylate-forming enzyme family protein [Myxococcota bacterium]
MIQSSSLWELIEARARKTPDALFAVDDGDRQLSFETYRHQCLRCASGLSERGITAGSSVSWALPTGLESLILMGALARLAARQNPILPIYREREIGFIVQQSECRLLVVPREFRGYSYGDLAAHLAAQKTDLDVHVVDAGLPAADEKSLPGWTPVQPDNPDSNTPPATWLFYTSGTTADPKGALHTDQSLLAYAFGMADCLQLNEEDRIALVFPITHIGGVGWLMAGLMSGAAQICVAQFDAQTTPAVLARHGVTQAAAGTAFHQAYLEAQRAHGQDAFFPRVRSFPGGGAPKPPQLHFDIKREMGGQGIVSGYGLTECPTCSMNRVTDPDEKLAHTEGRANPSDLEFKIVKLDDSVAGIGEEGEVRMKGPQLFKGYLDPALGADAFDDQGFFRSGDLGRLDSEGFLSITGRIKDIIVRKGENISAKEVEDLLHEHPGIAEAAAIGLPDPKSGERCCAVLVATQEGSPPEFKEIIQFLRDKGLTPQKLPEQIEWIDGLPRNATGKVLKHELRKQFDRTG